MRIFLVISKSGETIETICQTLILLELFKGKKPSENFLFITEEKENSLRKIAEKINAQIERTRNEETSPKNTTLYFNILLKSKDLYLHKLNVMETFLDNIRKIES